MPWTIAQTTHPGRVRDHNEDAMAVLPRGPDDAVLIVCDGMGGMESGELASAAAIEALSQPSLMDDPAPFAALFQLLRDADLAAQRAAPGGGTTGVVAVLRGGPTARAWYGFVGDSRLYHLRAGAVLERTRDHTLVNAMVQRGELRPEEAVHHPDAHVLVNALGSGDAHPEVFTEPLELAPGDVLLLCSDGLTDLLADEEIAAWATAATPEVASRLQEVALERGGHDNVTIVLASWTAGEPARRATITEEPVAPPQVAPQPAPPQPAPSPSGFPAAAMAATALVAGLVGLLLGWLIWGAA